MRMQADPRLPEDVAKSGPAPAAGHRSSMGRDLRRLATVGRVQCFESNAAAEAFIGEVCGLRTSLPATAQRHIDDLFGSQSPPPNPAASASRRATA